MRGLKDNLSGQTDFKATERVEEPRCYAVMQSIHFDVQAGRTCRLDAMALISLYSQIRASWQACISKADKDDGCTRPICISAPLM